MRKVLYIYPQSNTLVHLFPLCKSKFSFGINFLILKNFSHFFQYKSVCNKLFQLLFLKKVFTSPSFLKDIFAVLLDIQFQVNLFFFSCCSIIFCLALLLLRSLSFFSPVWMLPFFFSVNALKYFSLSAVYRNSILL